MTAPAMPAAPAVRAPATGGGGGEAKGADSAAPFASALDGALSEGRAAVGEGSAEDAEQQDPGTPAGTVVPVETGAPVAPPVGLTAALWALGLGVPQAPTPQGAPVDGAAVAAPGAVPASIAPTGTVPAPGLPGVPAPGTAPVAPATAGVPGLPGTPPATDPAADPAAAPTPGTAVPAPAAGAPSTGPIAGVPDLLITGPEGTLPAVGTGTARTPAPPAPAALTEAVPAAAPAAVPGAGTASSTGTGGDAGSAAAGGEPAESPEAPAPVSGAAPAAPVAAAADADGPTGTPAGLPVAGQVARHVAVLRGAPDGSHTMTLVLTPDTLGPVEVSVTVTDDTVDLVLRGAHEQGRVALLDALPDLRRDLEAAGLTTSRMAVDRETGGSWLARHHADQQAQQQGQQGSGQRPGQQEPGEGRSRPWLRPADSESSRSAPTTRSTSAGVDVRV